jgi:zinc and cadmium transporter
MPAPIVWPWIILFGVVSSLGAVAGAALVLLAPARTRQVLIPCFVSYATGTLLAAAFLGMIPAALEHAPARTVTSALLAGFVLFFVLEKVVLWRHCHVPGCAVHGRAAPIILVGDGLHNFVDGVVVATAFHASIPLGISASLAVIAHEIPQEVGDFAILLESGYGRRRALALNLLSAATALPGAAGAHFWLSATRSVIAFVLALAAASFVYVAAADLMPELHRQVRPGASARQLGLLLAGIATIAILRSVC